MFLLNNTPISPDVAFTHNGIQYPADWIRLASPEERAAIGITEAPDPEPYDQRFFWGPGQPKDRDQVATLLIEQAKTAAGSLLAQTDWMITRQQEIGTDVPESISNYRDAVRDVCNLYELQVADATTTEELVELGLPQWPNESIHPRS